MTKARSYIFFYVLYIIISVILASWTTGGWSFFAVIILYIPLSLLPLILYIIFFIILRLKKRGIRFSKYEKLLFLVILIVQLFSLLFNIGDCGDAIGAGPYNFIQRISEPQMFDSYGSCVRGLTPIFPNSFVLWIVYFFGLTVLPVLIFIHSMLQPYSQKKSRELLI